MNLLILGAGQYGMVAKEAAVSMQLYEKIAFLDDSNPIAVGKLNDYPDFINEFSDAVVAVGNTELRLKLLDELEQVGFNIPSLIHNSAYVSPSAVIESGCIIEPLVVIHTDVKTARGCLISAGAILNHNAVIEEGCHIDCGAIVGARKNVPMGTITRYGEVLI